MMYRGGFLYFYDVSLILECKWNSVWDLVEVVFDTVDSCICGASPKHDMLLNIQYK